MAARGPVSTTPSPPASGSPTRPRPAQAPRSRFTGSSVSWIAYHGPNRGSASIYLDGVYKGTVNLYDPTYYARYVAYAASWSSNGSHTLRVVNLGTAGHSRVDVDGFLRIVLT